MGRGQRGPEAVCSGDEPITLGVPVPRGVCVDLAGARLTASGLDVPLQARALSQWSDGSVKWALLDFQHRATARSPFYEVTWNADRAARLDGIRIDESADEISVHTGTARFTIGPGSFPFRGISIDDHGVLPPAGSALIVEDADGRLCDVRFDQIAVEERGHLRTVVRIHGSVFLGGTQPVDVVARLHFFASLSTVRVALTLTNPTAAAHRGGYWELGDAGSAFFRDVSVRLLLTGTTAGTSACSVGPADPVEPCVGSLSIYQDSSGGENWASSNHVNRAGRVPTRFRGYTMTDGRGTATGLRANPLVALQRGDAWIGVAMPHFWENFPKAVEAAGDAVTLRLWPHQYDDVHELQGGEQKTHVFYVAAGMGAADAGALDWSRQPSVAMAEPNWYCSAGAIPWLSPEALALDGDYVQLVNVAVDGADSFESKREIIDEYGWRNFGDLYADHEAVRHQGPAPLVSHYNNQYDAIAGFAYQFFRTGDVRWWRAMDELAAHVVDIDVYHATGDKSAYSGGLFWHTTHYADAGRSTHRSYPQSSGCSGGPGNEHNYGAGLMLHYLLTGNSLSKDAAVGLAEWVVNMDDGRRTPLRWVSRSSTGLASATVSPDYHGPGRGAGYSIQALLNGFELTAERRFLDKAEELIRRCVHPDEDVSARDLLDRERRWSYTVFLQALGRFLWFKQERGERDAMYAYTRRVLLEYARWMADHEYPYLDKPEVLEFPTETWAAQDARKSEVFDLAALCASGEERRLFLEKAEFFWRYATTTLLEFPTRRLTRPVVLMLGHGFLRASMPQLLQGPFADPVTAAHGAPASPFVPQRTRVKAQIIAAGVGGAITLGAVALWALVLRLSTL